MPPPKLFSVWSVVGFLVVISTFQIILADGTASFDVQDVGVNTTVTFQPVYLEGSDGAVPEVVAASRVRIPGWSRLEHVDKFYHTFHVKIQIAPYRSLVSDSRVYVCPDQDPLRSLGDCRNGTWRAIDREGSWTFSMSPFQDKFVDIRVTKSFSAPAVTVSVTDEKSSFRLIFLGLGFVLLLVAPIVSAWVPFYYGTAMTLGILMVVIVILFQGMKLLPTGRKSTLYIILYGSLAGLGTVVLRYLSSLVTAALLEMGLSEDMYSPVAIFLGVGIALIGAWLGYLGVRKFVIAEDGSIDDGVAIFVKWALRVLGSFALLQSSSDPVFMMLAFIGGSVFSWAILNVPLSLVDFWENIQDVWTSQPFSIRNGTHRKETRKPYMTQAQINAVERIPGAESLFVSKKGLAHYRTENYRTEKSPAGTRGKRNFKLDAVMTYDVGIREEMNFRPDEVMSYDVGIREKIQFKPDEVFLSTYHESPPGYRTPSKREYADITRDCTRRAVAELTRSDKFDEWREENRLRITVAPLEHRHERPVEEIEHTASLAEATSTGGLYSNRKRWKH